MWAKNEGVPGPDPGQGDLQEVECLSRVFRWCLPTNSHPKAIEIDAGAGHVNILTHQLNLQGDKSVATPGVKNTTSDVGLPAAFGFFQLFFEKKLFLDSFFFKKKLC